ncbi:MAG TPA: hypothetical protein VG757_12965 [Devosia sp.]|nr:hypothetical protein [Devosia sp.]
MNRNTGIVLGAVAIVLIVIALLVYQQQRSVPVIQVETGGASVNIGAGGISVSVPPSQQ